jgi:hypothetical protein
MHIFELSGAVLNYNAELARERLISLMNKGKTEDNDKNGNQLEQGDDNQDGSSDTVNAKAALENADLSFINHSLLNQSVPF